MNHVARRFSAMALSALSTGSAARATAPAALRRPFRLLSPTLAARMPPAASSNTDTLTRLLSTASTTAAGSPGKTSVDAAGLPVGAQVSMGGNLLTDEAGKQYGVFMNTRHMPKLKPYIVKRRLNRLKTYIGTEKEIRQSPWKLNRVCQLAAGLTLEEALTQLRFCDIKNSDLIAKILKRTSNLADIRHGLQMSQLEVAECYTTKGMMLKRIKPMARGRAGIMHHKFSHVRVVLREIDFKLKIYQARSIGQKKKWLQHQIRAEKDAKEAKAKRDEMDRLLKKQEEQRQKRMAEQKK